MAPLLALALLICLPFSGLVLAATPAPNPEPECTIQCLGDYYYNSNGTSDCAINDNACVCADPVFPHLVSCCMASTCNATDIQKGSAWLQWACGVYKIETPSFVSCLPPPDTTTTTSTTSSAVTASSVTTVMTSSVSTATTSTVSTSELEVGAQAPNSPGRTSSGQASTTSIPSASSHTPTPTPTAQPSNDSSNTLAIGLGVGLGAGLPLTVSAIGLIAFLVWRARRCNDRRSSSPLPARPSGTDVYAIGPYTRESAAGGLAMGMGTDFDKRWHPVWAPDMIPPARRQGGGMQMHELAS